MVCQNFVYFVIRPRNPFAVTCSKVIRPFRPHENCIVVTFCLLDLNCTRTISFIFIPVVHHFRFSFILLTVPFKHRFVSLFGFGRLRKY